MWAKMVFHRVETVYLPMVRAWPVLENGTALPVYVTRDKCTLAVCKEPIIEETCADTSILTRNGVESACLLCVNSLTCSINKRKRGDTFTPEDNLCVSAWDEKVLKKLTTTTEVPLLALFPNLERKLEGRPFEIEFIAELYEMKFDLERILKNLNILMYADPIALAKYQSFESFTKFLSNETEYRAKIRKLAAKLGKFHESDFRDAIETLKL